VSLRIEDLAYTLQERREHFSYRSAFCATNIDELIGKLNVSTLHAQTNAENDNKVVFIFPGQGVQYTQMAKRLYENEQVFKNTIDGLIHQCRHSGLLVAATVTERTASYDGRY